LYLIAYCQLFFSSFYALYLLLSGRDAQVATKHALWFNVFNSNGKGALIFGATERSS
jgi:hypothetical protein